jgi:hypothetical protein
LFQAGFRQNKKMSWYAVDGFQHPDVPDPFGVDEVNQVLTQLFMMDGIVHELNHTINVQFTF